VSIVDVSSPARAHVVRTLLVGDEPRDIVFAGPDAGVGRADVWVFDAAQLGATLGGTPMTVITLFADTPARSRRCATATCERCASSVR